MASIAHHFGVPPKSLSGRILRALPISDSQVSSLDLADPYGRAFWHGEGLRELRRTLGQRADALYEQARTLVCVRSHRREMEDWMQPRLEVLLGRNDTYRLLIAVLGLIDETLAANGTLVFVGD